jgi:hypothetical protein
MLLTWLSCLSYPCQPIPRLGVAVIYLWWRHGRLALTRCWCLRCCVAALLRCWTLLLGNQASEWLLHIYTCPPPAFAGFILLSYQSSIVWGKYNCCVAQQPVQACGFATTGKSCAVLHRKRCTVNIMSSASLCTLRACHGVCWFVCLVCTIFIVPNGCVRLTSAYGGRAAAC